MTEEKSGDHRADNPGVRVPPPLIPLAAIGIGYGLQRVWTLAPPDWAGRPILGWALVGAGVAILIASWVQVFRAKTNIRPDKPSSAIIRTGLYRFSRNLIYVSFVMLQAGIGLLMSNPWVVVLVPVSLILLNKTVIAREEAYLERAFGENCLAFKRAVRRWL